MHRIIDGLLTGSAGRVYRGMMTLTMGSAAARLIGVASIPILTRIYAPTDYGVLSVFTSLVALMVPIMTLRYAVAVPLPRHDAMAMNLLVLAGGLMLGMSLVWAVILWTFGPALLGLLSMEKLEPWRGLIVVGAMLTATYELMMMWATRRRAYRVIARTSVTQSLIGEALKISLGLLGLKPAGLLLGQIAGQSGGIGTFLTKFKANFLRNWPKVSVQRIAFLARYYRSFPAFRLPSQFLLALSIQSPMLFIASTYEAGVAGQFGLATMALALPANLISQSIGTAYYGEAAALSKKAPGKIYALTRKLQINLLAIGILPTTILFLWGDLIFYYAFGHRWDEAGRFAMALAPYLFVQITSTPLIQSLNIFNKQLVFLFINAARLAILALAFVLSRKLALDAPTFVAIYSVIMTIFYASISVFIILFLRGLAKNN
ncbi:oligosaccharide flippase family protein [Ancylobacter sp. A5.8]|uniref:lipopolysaccharide biosynthesis protein n=1 Tax=Ancylobacter gelatini TaxID=2919920 RepID=UPI001F4E05E8|nr:oligosaccharide flippase family protein [Ancylobacter gelatini]MCJ8142583.1 oligosaccharide flippase family protein [Ancylobacter gelatini]